MRLSILTPQKFNLMYSNFLTAYNPTIICTKPPYVIGTVIGLANADFTAILFRIIGVRLQVMRIVITAIL